MGGLLLDEHFVAVFPSLVKRLGGMNEAAILQTVHYASQVAELQLDGHRWVELTATVIARQTGLSGDQVFRGLTTLRELGVLIAQGSPRGGRKLIWRIDLDVLEGNPQDRGTDTAKTRNAFRESATLTTNTELQEESKNIIPINGSNGSMVVKAFVDEFTNQNGRAPDKASIARIGAAAKRLLLDGEPIDLLIKAAALCAKSGHANLSAAVLKTIGKQQEPRGFAGIREFLDDQP